MIVKDINQLKEKCIPVTAFNFGEGENINGIFEVIGEVLGTIVGIFIEPMLIGIRFITERIKAMANIFGGVIKIFQGDFEEGFRQIASGAIDFIIAPFQALADGVIGMINWIIKGINKILYTNWWMQS